MFQNHFESEDPSTLNLEESPAQEHPPCKIKCNSVLSFIILGFVFLLMAMIELITNYQELGYTLSLDYDRINNKIVSSSTYVSFNQDDSVAVYLHFKSFTQFSYVNKFDGENVEKFDSNADTCLQNRLNQDNNKEVSIDNQSLVPSAFALPCGKFPSMFVGDNIRLVLGNNTTLDINYNGLNVFQYDVSNLNRSQQWANLQSPLFLNWMQQNVALDTYKFIGKVHGRFQGQIYLQISLQNGFPIDFGEMSVVLSNNKALGGADPSFCYMNFIESALMFIFALIVYLYRKTMKQDVKNMNGMIERKIELRNNLDSMARKQMQF